MTTTFEIIAAICSTGILCGAILLFLKKYRKFGFRLMLLSIVTSFGIYSVGGNQKDEQAQQIGFLNYEDFQAANEAGIENPEDWAVVRSDREAERAAALTALKEQELLESACGDRHSVSAFVMSQRVVRAHLSAPATADFPTINSVSVRANGDCTFLVNAYVDAQNGFGALIRTNYTAAMRRNSDTETWSLIELNMQK